MDEKQLVSDADSNIEAFIELYRTNITRVYRYHMVHVGDANYAEDLTIQTFMAMLKELPSLRGKGSFGTGVLGIALGKRLKDHRGSRREISNDAVLYYQVSGLPSDRTTMQRMEIESTARAMKQIPSDRAEALILHHFSGLSHSEIGIVLKKNVDTIGVLITRGWQDLYAHTFPRQSMETTASKETDDLSLEVEMLVDKLNSIAAQIVPDPMFVSELEQTLAANYHPKIKWTLPLKQFTTAVGWAMLIGLTFFLLNWRVDPGQSSTFQATASPSAQTITKAVVSTTTSTPRHPTSNRIVTATTIPMREYIVQAGDTCTYIANKFGVTIDLLTTFNRLNSTCDIWVDQKLMVPIAPTPTSSN